MSTTTFSKLYSQDNELPRFIHHLGLKYAANFQSDDLIKQLTYEASTSLNIHLFNLGPQTVTSGLLKVLKTGVGFNEDSVVFLLKPSVLTEGDEYFSDSLLDEPVQAPASPWKRQGDIVKAESHGFDYAVWKLGGAAVYLRLVQLASVSLSIVGMFTDNNRSNHTLQNPHELSRALGILTDGLRNSWQLSEDMEQLRGFLFIFLCLRARLKCDPGGYDILNHLLRSKANLINMTGFETLFEFLGLNFRSTE